jgi:hypothetical protein
MRRVVYFLRLLASSLSALTTTLSVSNLTTVPSDIPFNTTSLMIDGNFLKVFGDNFTKLISRVASDNHFSVIGDSAFDGPVLSSLTLMTNQLTEVSN